MRFLPVKGYEGLYEVTEIGQVRSIERKIQGKDGAVYPFKGRILCPHTHKDTGYLQVSLWKENKGTQQYIHRLVAEAFIPKDEGRDFVNHINGNKQDYNLSNLEWCTRSENMLHSTYVLGNPKPPNPKGKTGRLCKLSKPVVATCVLTGSVLIFESARDAERVSGGNFHNYGIGQSIKGAYSCHRGYVWSLLEGEYDV